MKNTIWPWAINTDSTIPIGDAAGLGLQPGSLGSVAVNLGGIAEDDFDFDDIPDGIVFGEIPFDIPPAENGEVRHVVIDHPPGGIPRGKQPTVDLVIATEDDFEPGCPCCEPMRQRVANGEEIEIAKVRWE
jgi:hypothetical protein